MKWQRRYVYDRWGNRTQVWNATSGGSQLQTVALVTSAGVPINRVANVNGAVHTYDNAGNVTGGAGRSYAYDGANRQVSVDNGVTSASAYDSINRRVKKVVAGVTTHYVWEGNEVIAEYNGSTGALISEYVYAGSRMIAREQGSSIRYFHPDKLSARMMTDGAGVVVGTQDHLPFGEDALTGIGENEKHRFTHYERDSEVGMDYAVNRQYETNTGRFMRPDPVAGSTLNPQSLNRYAYSLNNPTNLIDPAGLNSYDPYEWTRDASIRGPGIYIDGFQVMQGQESLFFGVIASGAGIIAPTSARLFVSRDGGTYITKYTSLNTGKGALPDGSIHLGTTDRGSSVGIYTDLIVPVALPSRTAMIARAYDIAMDALNSSPECRDYLSGPLWPDPRPLLEWLFNKNRIKPFRLPNKDAIARWVIWPGAGKRGQIELNDSFFTPDVSGTTDTFPGLSSDAARALTILHELGHGTGANAHGAWGDKTYKYDRKIYRKCLKGLRHFWPPNTM